MQNWESLSQDESVFNSIYLVFFFFFFLVFVEFVFEYITFFSLIRLRKLLVKG